MLTATPPPARRALAILVAVLVGATVAPWITRITTERGIAQRCRAYVQAHGGSPGLLELLAGAEAEGLEYGGIASGARADAIAADATGVPRVVVAIWRVEVARHEAYFPGCLPRYAGSRGDPRVYVGVTALAMLLAVLAVALPGRRRGVA